jgi:dTDP-4-dehydrorhamnose reductase
MRILLSGASGLLGSAVVQQLSRHSEIELTVVRSSRVECTLPLGSSEVFIEDVSKVGDLERQLAWRPPTHIMHLAALSSPAECENDPPRAHVANVGFTRTLGEIARRFQAHMVLASTDLVFEGTRAPEHGFDEYALPCPVSVYARTKRQAERETLENTDGAVVRLSLLYGHTFSASKGVLGWMEEALRNHREIVLFKDEFRTPIHLQDAARALVSTCERKLTGVWHCGGPKRVSRVEFGRLVAQLGGFSTHAIREANRCEVPSVPARPEDVSLNSTRLISALGIAFCTPRTALESEYATGRDEIE